MKGNPEQRAILLGEYMVEHRATVRSAAAAFGISKSTVHKDLRTLLPKVSRSLYLEVLPILEENKAQRHIRGGMATRQKYRGVKLL